MSGIPFNKLAIYQLNRKVYCWMNKNIVTLLTIIGSIASIIGVVLYFIKSEGKSKKDDFKKEELEIKHLTTGITRSFIESKFGVPVVVEEYRKYKTKGLYFNFKRFYLTVLVDKNGMVLYYSITSKDRNFRPPIPYLEAKLGDKTFSELGTASHLYSYKSSKYYEYAEVTNLGNPSSYRNIYLAFHSSGVDFSKKEHSYAVLSMDGPNEVAAFRQQARPNTYGIGDIHGFKEEEEVLKEIGVGIEYFAARDLP